MSTRATIHFHMRDKYRLMGAYAYGKISDHVTIAAAYNALTNLDWYQASATGECEAYIVDLATGYPISWDDVRTALETEEIERRGRGPQGNFIKEDTD